MAFRLETPLRAYRIADARHPLFDGAGAALTGGRWNSPGRPVIYASASFACAMLEKLAQTGTGRIPRNQVSIEIEVPEGTAIQTVSADDLPGWERADYTPSLRYGDAWLQEGSTAVLLVPSIVARADHNVLINPRHSDVGRIAWGESEPVVWDERLFAQPGPPSS